ncbi:MAG: hypothetical protein IIA05_05430 [Proteobacteria bacterium]|nr:hypothetical protein [Pseudomonadota bacterium]MCH9026544.1 hypothetical protein [Pseudomonadota bacterium]
MTPRYRISYRKPGPVAQLVSFITGILALGLAAFLGIFILVVLVGLIVIGSAVFAMRLWWIKRKIEQAVRDGRSPGDVVHAEYMVIEERKTDWPEV